MTAKPIKRLSAPNASLSAPSPKADIWIWHQGRNADIRCGLHQRPLCAVVSNAWRISTDRLGVLAFEICHPRPNGSWLRMAPRSAGKSFRPRKLKLKLGNAGLVYARFVKFYPAGCARLSSKCLQSKMPALNFSRRYSEAE